MPNYYELYWEKYALKVSVRPVGIRGWWIIRKLTPYLSGDIMNLVLVEKKLDNKSQDFDYDWIIWHDLPDGDSETAKRIEGSFTSKSSKPAKHSFGTYLIQSPGHFLCQLLLRTNRNGEDRIRKTMLIFDALAGDTWRTDMAFRLLFLILGLILGALLTLWITP